jgi:site-specific recombinase XerD
MSKLQKNYTWLRNKPNSAKTAIAQAEREVPHFSEHIAKFNEQVILKSYAEATVFSYSRAIAQVALYFKKSPLYLDPEEINSYLFGLRIKDDKSDTYFKHAVYGLRFFFRIYDLDDKALRLPSLKHEHKLPVVLSDQELKRLFKAPQRLKQRVLLSLIYSAGLRLSEVCALKIADIDFDRMQIHVRFSKGYKSRYVVLSSDISIGLKQYIAGVKPKDFLFNGRAKGSPLSHSAVQQSFRLAMSKAEIIKDATVHSLRHSYATHCLEQGVDIVTIKEQLGHARLETTLMYLHIAQIKRTLAHSPFDRLYRKGGKA